MGVICASISQCPLPITPCNLIPISANDDEAEWDATLEQGGGGGGVNMPQCITSQCVRPAGQRADDREGVGKTYGLHVLEVGGNCDMDRCQSVNRPKKEKKKKREKAR